MPWHAGGGVLSVLLALIGSCQLHMHLVFVTFSHDPLGAVMLSYVEWLKPSPNCPGTTGEEIYAACGG
jgi:hypothetical protein